MREQNYDSTLTTSKIGNIEIMTLGCAYTLGFGTVAKLAMKDIVYVGVWCQSRHTNQGHNSK